jgi:catechol 2,3-dioxygenase
MKIVELGHVNLWVSDLDRSARFYGDVLGFPEVARGELRGRPVAFYSLGLRHHDLALIQIGGDAGEAGATRPGLNHIGLKIGNSVNELRQMRDHLLGHGFNAVDYRDHVVCKSIHVRDPDGITIELYVDGDPTIWANNPHAMVSSEPLQLD